MGELVQVALISAFATLLGSGITAISGLAIIRHRLNAVEKKLDEHNGYAKLYAESHEDIAILKVDVGYIKESIHRIEGKGK